MVIEFNAFCDAYLEGLARYARLLCPDRYEAQDLLQEALLAAHVHWNRIGSMDHPAAYVRTVITSKHLKRVRRWSARHVQLSTSGELPELHLADPTQTVDRLDELRQLLTALSPRQRAAVVLRHFVGLSDEEIAAELGISAATVRPLISRALSSVRLSLGVGSRKDPA